MDNSKNIRNIVATLDDLPTLPTVFTKINDLIQDPKTSAVTLGRAIGDDPSLTVKILKIVNSAIYGFPSKISTINQAIVVLGFSAIKNLVLSSSVFDLFKADKINDINFDLNDFWGHSMGCAVIANTTAKYLQIKDTESIFVSGLLHDIGKIVYFQYFSDKFRIVLNRVAGSRINDVCKIEDEVMGFDHQHTGRLLSEKWQLPQVLIEPIAYHHNPTESRQYSKQTAIIHISDIIATAMELGSSGGGNYVPQVSEDAWNNLGLKLSVLEPIIKETKDKYADIVSFLMPAENR